MLEPRHVDRRELLATLTGYAAAKWLYSRHRRIWLSPMLLTPAMLVALLWASGVSYASYGSDTRLLVWMLGPATIAYAWPIYQRRALIRRYPVTLASGVAAGLLIGLGSTWTLGRLLALPPDSPTACCHARCRPRSPLSRRATSADHPTSPCLACC